MSGYETDLQESSGYGSSSGGNSGVNSYKFSKVFVPSMAPAYPSIEDELKRDVTILTRSLELRGQYIDDLRDTKDRLVREIKIKDMEIEEMERSIKRYQEYFSRTREQEMIQ